MHAQHDAYKRGFETPDLLSNPYPDGGVEARRFVDGWVDGRKWVKPAQQMKGKP